ncbi:MAG: putative TerL [Caudoviricetes sp.]|nr:MAG: putative TerL [Caudoviricetes sp.]
MLGVIQEDNRLDRNIIAPLQDSSDNLRLSQPIFIVGEHTLDWGAYINDTPDSEIKLPVLKVLENRRETLNSLIVKDALRKIAKGPRGTGKTTDSLAYAFLWACHQPPDYKGVRKSRIGAFKKTESEILTSLLPSIEKQYGPCFRLETKQPLVGRISFKLPDETIVDAEIIFKHMQNLELGNQKKGFEVGLVVVDEIDQLETPSSFEGVCQSARGGKDTFKGGVLGTCNGLCIEGFLYSQIYSKADDKGLIFGMENKPIYCFISQPPALLRPDDPNGEWLPNPLAYNIENIPEGYNYYTPIIKSGDDRMIRSSVEGISYSKIIGELVLPQLGNLNYVSFKSVEIDIKSALKNGFYMGFDFGKFPVCLIATLTSRENLIVFKELYPDGPTNLQDFMSYTVIPFLRRELYNYSCKGAFIDPSGYKDSVLTGMSSKDLLELKFDLPVNTSIRNNNLGPRLNAVINRAVTLSGDKPKLLICNECELLTDALKNTYVLDDEGKPKKVGHKNFSHDLADCLQYLCLGLDDFEVSDYTFRKGITLSRAVI